MTRNTPKTIDVDVGRLTLGFITTPDAKKYCMPDQCGNRTNDPDNSGAAYNLPGQTGLISIFKKE